MKDVLNSRQVYELIQDPSLTEEQIIFGIEFIEVLLSEDAFSALNKIAESHKSEIIRNSAKKALIYLTPLLDIRHQNS